MQNLEEYYETLYTYESNRIEGNSLTLDETHFVINEGLTIGGKPLKDHLEAINHKEAYNYIRKLAKNEIYITEQEILTIHELILRTIDNEYAGRYRNMPVRIGGSQYVFPNHLKVAQLMTELLEWYERNKHKLHPVLLAGEMHQRLVTIHPFKDGNGRTSRLLMNLILLQNGFPIVNISGEKKQRKQYYNALEYSNMKEDKTPFLNLVLKEEKKSLFDYINIFANNMETKNKGQYFFKKIEKILK